MGARITPEIGFTGLEQPPIEVELAAGLQPASCPTDRLLNRAAIRPIETRQSMTAPSRVLFLCTHNSSRSQMAEALLRTRGGDRYAVFSAGTQPTQVHPLAIRALAELGIDLSAAAGYHAKPLTEFIRQPPMDLVVTVCDEAAEACPSFPNARRQEHWGFPDPSAATGSEDERLAVFRRVRDALAARIAQFLRDYDPLATA
jgi:arsenate reductase